MASKNLHAVPCRDCGKPTDCAVEAHAVICGSCVQLLSFRGARELQRAAGRFTPDLVKAFRAERGWTQMDLATKARCPVEDVRVVEQGRGLPSDKLAKFLSSELGE